MIVLPRRMAAGRCISPLGRSVLWRVLSVRDKGRYAIKFAANPHFHFSPQVELRVTAHPYWLQQQVFTMASRKKRNHFIPRALLNRFSSRSEPKRGIYWIWWHPTDGESKEVSTRDVGLGKFFYGKEVDLEEQFAVIEGQLGSALAAIDQSGCTDDYEVFLNDYTWVQAIRTRSFRERFRQTAERVFVGAANKAHSDEAKLSFKNAANEQIASFASQFSPEQLALIQSRLGDIPLNEFLDTSIKKEIESGVFSSIFERHLRAFAQGDDLIKGVEKGHQTALSQMLTESKISPDKFQAKWILRRYPSESLILGDSCIFTLDSQNLPHPLNDAINWTTLYFPISPTQCLIGHRTRESALLTAAQINVASAKSSLEQFFACKKNEEILALKSLVEANTEMLSAVEIDDVTSSVWRRLPS